MKKIAVVGSLNMDLVMHAPRFPHKGETILGHGFMMNPGGKGGNQAVAVARLGNPVFLVGSVGMDFFGDRLLEQLSKNEVDVEFVHRDDSSPTGTAIVILHDNDNAIIVDPGANHRMSPETIMAIEHRIQQSALVLMQLEIPLDVVKKTLEICRRSGVRSILNPAPAAKLSEELLQAADYLTPNETEAESLTGVVIRNLEDAREAVLKLLERGSQQVVLTLGEQGALFNHKGRLIHQQGFPVNPVDTTSAGDAFNGALAIAITRGWDVDEAVSFACKAGALAVTRKGAQSCLPTLQEIENFS